MYIPKYLPNTYNFCYFFSLVLFFCLCLFITFLNWYFKLKINNTFMDGDKFNE